MTETAECLACERSQDEVPLVSLVYRGTAYWICPQHLPLLIHDPAQLAGKIEGAERMEPAEHHD
jgi:hypothetical protein